MIHVLPINDKKPHIESIACKCRPVIEVNKHGECVVVHNSWDGREHKEKLMKTNDN